MKYQTVGAWLSLNANNPVTAQYLSCRVCNGKFADASGRQVLFAGWNGCDINIHHTTLLTLKHKVALDSYMSVPVLFCETILN